MADAIVSMVLERSISYAQQKVELVAGVRGQVSKLNVTLRMIQEVLQDAEQKQEKNSAVKVWLEELKGVLYDADDVMDEWNTKMAIFQLRRVDVDDKARGKKVLSHIRTPFSYVKNVKVGYHTSHRIKKIREELDEISTRKNQFGLVVSSSHIQARRLTSSFVNKVCGRDADKEEIVSRLLGESSRQETGVQVVSIVAMGGFGKTTLANLVLKDEKVVRSFEKMMWVCVSEPFDLIVVAKAIIEEVGGEVPSSTEWQAVHKGLSQSVNGIRFLLVLDDVWTKDFNHWNHLKLSLDGGAPGSRVMVTTRNMEVAHMMGSSHIHNLEELSKSDSWSLLGDIALMGTEEEREKFEDIGKEIANKCKGVPLALLTLASLLREKRTVENWRDILKSDIWELAHIKDFFLPSLFLSYYSLPSTSKQCFLYCAVFPKDTKMEKDLLVKLWMAEGFLGSGGTEELEKVGEDHFHNLAVRSFFQDFEKKPNGNITSCKMHDLVHDFAQYLSGGECWNNAEFNCDKVRYLRLEKIENPSLYEAKKLRTLLNHKGGISVELFSKLPCLRVLDLGFREFQKLPEAVERLIHLRYLDLSYNIKMEELPETICNLYNLQTLRLNQCWGLKKLPEKIGRLFNLRHLEMEYTHELHCLPQSIKRLSSLRTLSKFIVKDGCKIGGLKDLKKLRGSLELIGLGRMTDENDAGQAELKGKEGLRCLSLDWGNSGGNDAAGAVGMLERLEPHEELEELKMKNYPASQLPRWFHNSCALGNIVKLELCNCCQITELPALGKLGSLESLKIENMDSMKLIGREFYYGLDSSLGEEMIAFPKLKTLELRYMAGLENWELPIISKDTKIMLLLSKLCIEFCPKLKALPACLGKLESLEELEIRYLHSIERLDLNLVMSKSMPQEDQVLFPKLRKLDIHYMTKLEQWNMMMPCLSCLKITYCPRLRVLPDLTKFKFLVTLGLHELEFWEGETEKEEENVRNEKKRLRTMPYSFTELSIDGCPELIQVPTHLFSPWLKQLRIEKCPKLSGSQCLPPLLETLTLIGDCGGYSKSIPLQNNEECSITHFSLSSHISLPDGFRKLKALRKLIFYCCESLDFELKELQHFTMLQQFEIYECPLLEERFQGDDWRSILPHVPKIIINNKEIH